MKLKNNEERMQFLKDFKKWPVWVRVKKLGSVHYRHELPDGTAIVASQYTQNYDYPGSQLYTVIRPGKSFSPHGTSMSSIIDMLRTEYKNGI